MNRKVTKKRIPSFADFCFRESGIEVKGKGRPAEPFSRLSYNDEYSIRDNAFKRFCDAHHLKIPENLVPAPVPRGYRTTSKRKALFVGKKLRFLSDIDDVSGESALEPESHRRILSETENLISSLPAKLQSSFNYCIVRGIGECALIFNVSFAGSQMVQALESAARDISAKIPELRSAFIFHDPSKSKYYFESSALADERNFRRLFGSRTLTVRAGGVVFHHHPLSFSQVNIPVAEKIALCLSDYFGDEGGLLSDLYCGYGFFSCIVGRYFREVVGIDNAGASILSAVENARHIPDFPKSTFHTKRIDAKAVHRLLPEKSGRECLILDPPRKGCVPGVISACAQRKPEKVAHIFCGAEEIPSEIALWRSSGYRVVRIIPFDMFPGTASVETVVLLEPCGSSVKQEEYGKRRSKPFVTHRRKEPFHGR
jgi:tRNA/tmRNA/rRNA uracil-C5-methylase (TrmA/RlmC/RlmD family)